MTPSGTAGLEIEVRGAGPERAAPGPGVVRRAARAALAAAEVDRGHLAVTFVDASRMRALNRAHRGLDAPTDVLSFPIDERGPQPGPSELGDVVICPELCAEPVEAVVHGVLHLAGHDHEADGGEMLELQARVIAALR